MTRLPMTRLPLRLPAALALAVLAAGAVTLVPAQPALAYSYAAAGAEPLLDGREALFAAAAAKDWPAAAKALDAMTADLDYLDAHEAPGIAKDFTSALAAQDAAAVKATFLRAAGAEIDRRLAGARDNIKDYQTAKVLVVKAQRFYTAIAADLPAATSEAVASGMKRALDAIGNPGVFGVGAKPADLNALISARSDILKALGRPG